MSSGTEFLYFSVNFLKNTGLLPSSPIHTKLFSFIVVIPLSSVLMFLIIYSLTNLEKNIFIIIEAFESISTYTQLLALIFILISHGSMIEEIINDCSYFWKYDLFGLELQTNLAFRMQLCIRIIKMLFFSVMITLMFIILSAINDDTKTVPFYCWIPEVHYAEEVIFVVEILILMVAVYYVLAVDSFYVLICMELQIQFKLMCAMVNSIRFGKDNEKNCLKKLTKCVENHNKLLRLHNKLNKVFSEYFIMQYNISISAVALQCYFVLYGSVTLSAILKSVFYVLTVMFQVGLYFISCSNVEIEAENYSKILYMIEWENTRSEKVTKHFLLMLLNSQKELSMSGAGMLHINRPQYLTIPRMGFAIASILGGLNSL